MCRRNQLYGCTLIAYGAGILTGALVSAQVLCVCLGLGALIAGALFLCRK